MARRYRYDSMSGDLCSGGFRGGSWGSMKPPFGLAIVLRSTDDRLNGTPVSGYKCIACPQTLFQMSPLPPDPWHTVHMGPGEYLFVVIDV